MLVLALLLFGCTPALAPTAATLCQGAAVQYSAQIAAAAARNNQPASTVTAQYVVACADRIEADIQDTAADLVGIPDGGSEQ